MSAQSWQGCSLLPVHWGHTSLLPVPMAAMDPTTVPSPLQRAQGMLPRPRQSGQDLRPRWEQASHGAVFAPRQRVQVSGCVPPAQRSQARGSPGSAATMAVSCSTNCRLSPEGSPQGSLLSAVFGGSDSRYGSTAATGGVRTSSRQRRKPA